VTAAVSAEPILRWNGPMTDFADLHTGPLPLLLPNAWDVPSALAFAAAGYSAVATTSLGVAASHGVPDGRSATRDANRALAASLDGLPVMLSIDCEDGYSDEPGGVAAYVADLCALGVVGVNLEDSVGARLVEPTGFAAKVAAVKVAAPDVFVNARVDTYWFHQDESVEATLARAFAYVEAGADGVFVPGLTEPDTIREIAGALAVPLNVLAVPEHSVADLGALGVRRVSTGSLPYRAGLAAAIEAAAAAGAGSSWPASVSYGDLQARLSAYADGA
jgi:2-methylisocitrate lyase-like PEP mutase family enzyme